MNYRHSFHAGNFADLVKHAGLLRTLALMQAASPAVRVIDTHGGAGRYLLTPANLETGEASATARLLATENAPGGLAELRAAVRNEGGKDEVAYPGSPLLVARRLRPRDSLLACELRPEEHGLLQRTLAPFAPRATAALDDGYERLERELPGRGGATLILIDPPYERGDDYLKVEEACSAAMRADPAAVVLIWAPLKDLETFDRLLRELEGGTGAPGVALEVRLRPLLDPLRMNGCGLVVLNPPQDLAPELLAAARWVVDELGGEGGRASLIPLAER